MIYLHSNKQVTMALEMNDLMALKSLENGMSPYEQFKTQHIQTKSHTSGIGVAGLVLGTVGTAAAIGAWIFAPMYGNAKAAQAREAAQSAKDTATLLYNSNQRQLDQLTNLFAAERAERIAGDVTLSNTVNDTVSGQQASTLTAQQAAELSAVNSVMQQTYSDFVTGRASLNPQPVAIYQDAKACPCASCGCGCNG